MDCGYSCHDKCQENVPKNCTKYKAVSDSSNPNQTLTRNGGDNGSVNSSKLHHQIIEIGFLSLMTIR